MTTEFERLVKVMERLRGEGGCPWDRQQTRESLRPFLVEETHEVLEAIEEGRPELLKEELGDLLFQVMFHAQIAAEAGEFGIRDVIEATIDKMTRRHPHVFGHEASDGEGHGQTNVKTADEVLARWEEMKRREEGHRSRSSAIDGVPRTLPALLRAHQVQAKASRIGFDWREIVPVMDKVTEEWGELTRAIETEPRLRQEEELGDLLFAVVNLARFLRVNPEDALHRTTRRFLDRFRRMEALALQEGRPLGRWVPESGDGGGGGDASGVAGQAMWTLEELDRLWEQAKLENKG